MAIFGTIAGVIGGNTRRAAMKSVEKKLRDGGAVSSKTAITPKAAKITSKGELWGLDYLVKRGTVGRTEDGKYWWK